jgi:hypothetical protein
MVSVVESAWEIHNDNGIYMIDDRVQFAMKRNNVTYTPADDEYHLAIPGDMYYITLDNEVLEGTQLLLDDEDAVDSAMFRL